MEPMKQQLCQTQSKAHEALPVLIYSQKSLAIDPEELDQTVSKNQLVCEC